MHREKLFTEHVAKTVTKWYIVALSARSLCGYFRASYWINNFDSNKVLYWLKTYSLSWKFSCAVFFVLTKLSSFFFNYSCLWCENCFLCKSLYTLYVRELNIIFFFKKRERNSAFIVISINVLKFYYESINSQYSIHFSIYQ